MKIIDVIRTAIIDVQCLESHELTVTRATFTISLREAIKVFMREYK